MVHVYVYIWCLDIHWEFRNEIHETHLAGGLGAGGRLQGGDYVREEVEQLAQVRRVVPRLQPLRHEALQQGSGANKSAAAPTVSGRHQLPMHRRPQPAQPCRLMLLIVQSGIATLHLEACHGANGHRAQLPYQLATQL